MTEFVPLRDIADFISTGKTPPTKETKYFGGDVYWYTPGDLDREKHLQASVRSLTELAFTDKKAAVFPADTLLISCIGDIGKLGITSNKSSSNQQITGIKPNERADVSYLYYWFRFSKYYLEQSANNAVVPILNNRALEKIKIPLPPLAEQKKIAAILDAADQLRQKDQQLIDHYTALSQSLFLEMFGDPVSNPMGWQVGTLDDYCLKITDGTHQSPEFLSEGVPFLLVSNIVKNQIVFDTKKFVSETTYCQLTKSTPIEMGDLLYTSVGSYGNPAIVNTERKFCFQRHIAHLKPDSHKIHFRFLHGLLQSEYVKRQADRLARGVAQKTLNLKAIKSYEVFCPPLSVQMEYSNRVCCQSNHSKSKA